MDTEVLLKVPHGWDILDLTRWIYFAGESLLELTLDKYLREADPEDVDSMLEAIEAKCPYLWCLDVTDIDQADLARKFIERTRGRLTHLATNAVIFSSVGLNCTGLKKLVLRNTPLDLNRKGEDANNHRWSNSSKMYQLLRLCHLGQHPSLGIAPFTIPVDTRSR